jgi:hypothetical protein
MAKRSRRTRRQKREQQRVPETTTVETSIPDEVPARPVKRRSADFVQEYGYVYKELRNVLIIAVLMLVVLVGLSFVIYV